MMNGVAGGLMGEIERAFAEEYGFGAPPRMPRTIVAKSASELGAYAGRYVGIVGRDTARFDVSVAPDGKTLAVYNAGASVAADRAVRRRPVRGARRWRRMDVRAR